MRKRKIIISIVVVLCVFVGSYFIIKFGAVGRIYDALKKRASAITAVPAKNEAPEEFRYETMYDKDGNEYVIKTKKVMVFDEKGNEGEFWADTAVPVIIYEHFYQGKIEKIEDNKIYFTVEKELKEGNKFFYENVKDYQVIFDIDTYKLESDPGDSLIFYPKGLWGGDERFHSAEGMKSHVGEFLRVQNSLLENTHTGDREKALVFYETSLSLWGRQ